MEPSTQCLPLDGNDDWPVDGLPFYAKYITIERSILWVIIIKQIVFIVKLVIWMQFVQFVHLVSDPCTLDIDGITIGLTSTDVLFHLGAEEISRFAFYS